MSHDARQWKAVLHRDADYDYKFVYAVSTTGVYCKPSCPSRLAKRNNVRFYPSPRDAERAGFRACLRCKPDRAATETPIALAVYGVCRYIEAHADQPLTLKAIAKKSGYSVSHLHREFTKIIGSSPKIYHHALRNQCLKQNLSGQEVVTDAIYGAGYGSLSRVYEKLSSNLGMTPVNFRDGGAGLLIRYAQASTPLGKVLIGATARGICFLEFSATALDLQHRLAKKFPKATFAKMPKQNGTDFQEWIHVLNTFLRGKSKLLELPLDIRGTAFQVMVWRYLQTIPAGEVRSYTEVASALGQSRAARAVARACANNQIAVVIPCHRVIYGNGDLAGYRWGRKRKRLLLDLERRKANA